MNKEISNLIALALILFMGTAFAAAQTSMPSDSIYNLALSNYNNHKYKKAVRLFQEVLELDKKSFSEYSELIGNDSHWLASSYYKDGNIEEAKKYDYNFFDLEPIDRRDISSIMEYSKYSETSTTIEMAIFWANKCIEEEMKVLGSNHYFVFGSHCNLAMMYFQSNNESKCREHLVAAKKISQSLSTTMKSWKAAPYIIEAMLENGINNEKEFQIAIQKSNEILNGEVESNPIMYAQYMWLYLPYLASKDINVSNHLAEDACLKVNKLSKDKLIQYVDLIQVLNQYYISYNQPRYGIDFLSPILDYLKEEEAYPFLLSDLGVMYKLNGGYDKSINLLSESIALLKSKYSKEPNAWVEHLFRLGETYDLNRNFEAAMDCFKECLSISNKFRNDLAEMKIQSLHHLAAISTRTNNFNQAIKYLEDCVSAMNKIRVDNPSDYAYIYKELGVCYRNLDKDKSLGYINKAIQLLIDNSLDHDNYLYIELQIACIDITKPSQDIVENKLNLLLDGITSSGIQSSLNRIKIYQYASEYFAERHNYVKALSYIDQAIKCAAECPEYNASEILSEKCILEVMSGNSEQAWAFADEQYKQSIERFGQNSMQHMQSLFLYYLLIDRTLSFDKVNMLSDFGNELLEYSRTLSQDDPAYLQIMKNSAKFFYYVDPEKSMQILSDLESLVNRNPKLCNETDLIDLYMSQAAGNRNMANYDAAVKYCNLLIDNLETISFTAAKLNLLNEVGQTYTACNQFREAEKAFLQGCSIGEAVDGECIELYSIYGNLASLYNKMGQYDLALDYNSKKESHAGFYTENKIFNLSESLNKLWVKYDLGKKDECFSDILEIDNFISTHSQFPNLDPSLSHRLKAIYYYREGNFETAITSIEKALYVSNNIQNLNIAADIYIASNQASKALEYAHSALEIANNTAGYSSFDYVALYKRLGDIYLLSNQLDASLSNYRKCFDASAHFISDNILTLTSRQRADFWNANSLFYNSYLPFIAMNNDYSKEMNGLLYDASLFSNGLLLTADRHIQTLVNKAGDDVKSLYNEFSAKKIILTKMTEEHNDLWQSLSADNDEDFFRYVNSEENLKKYRLSCDSTERNLMNLIITKYPNLLSYRTYSWRDLQKKLSKTSAAIEYIDFPTDSINNTIGALVLRKNSIYPEFRILYHYPRSKTFSLEELYGHTTLGDSIISSLSDLISDCDKIYYSTQGLLSTISVTDLPLSDKIYEDCEFYRLSSTSMLLNKKAIHKENKATLFGGLNYDASVDSLIVDARKYPELRETSLNNNYFERSFSRESDSSIPLLPGTLAEVQTITEILESKTKIQPVMKTWNDGTESAFKALNGKYGAILHISTHGFFNVEGIINNPNVNALNYEDLAMEQSGLLLTGATNRFIDEVAMPENLNDGVLKASEIAKLDMQGVDLAVLSACETGLGALTSNGVLGLQRGLKKAGVNSMIMSLWKVDDEATSALMEEFYKNWLIGNKTKRQSLELAKDYIKSQPRWKNPRYWAAFILVDAIN